MTVSNMQADAAVIPLCGTAAHVWRPTELELSYTLYSLGKVFGRVRFRGVQLDAPFVQLPSELDLCRPDWSALPEDIEAALVPWQPVKDNPRPIYRTASDIRYTLDIQDRCYVDLRDTFDEYMKKFSAKQRYNILRTVKKFAEFSGGEIEWREYKHAEDILQFLELALVVARKSWQGQFGASLPDSDEFRAQLVRQASS